MPERITCEECEKIISDKQVVFCEPCVEQAQMVWIKLLSELLDALGIEPGHHIGEDVERAKGEARKAERLDAVIEEAKKTVEYEKTAKQHFVTRVPLSATAVAEALLRVALGATEGESDESDE